MSGFSRKTKKPIIVVMVEAQHSTQMRGAFQYYRMIALID